MPLENEINIRNKRASFEYSFIDKYVAGLQLTGTEIKSIRSGKASIAEAYCLFHNNELWVRNMNVNEYGNGTYNNHPPKRDRKLLLNKHELKKLSGKLIDKGLTVIPLRIFLSKSGFAKMEIALAKGKKIFDKREDIKKKDIERENSRKLK